MTRTLSPHAVRSLVVVGIALCAPAALLAPATARAQGASSNADIASGGEEVKGSSGVAEIRAVVRGLYLSVDVGPNYFVPIEQPGFVVIGTPFSVADPGGGPFNRAWITPGTRMGVRVGYDILNNIAADVFLLANFNRGYIDIDRFNDAKVTGDLAHFVPGLGFRFAFLTLPIEAPRLFVYTRVAAGYAFWFPQQLANDSLGSIHTDASIGIEYYTKLRHLSVGLEVAGQGLFLPMAFGFHVYPTVKYTFGD
jgi:hypothetical protein